MTTPNAAFYRSKQWHSLRRKALARDGYQCVICGACVRGVRASRVDHIQPVRTHPHLALDINNVRSLCPPCDNRRHADKAARTERTGVDLDGFPVNSEWAASARGHGAGGGAR